MLYSFNLKLIFLLFCHFFVLHRIKVSSLRQIEILKKNRAKNLRNMRNSGFVDIAKCTGLIMNLKFLHDFLLSAFVFSL